MLKQFPFMSNIRRLLNNYFVRKDDYKFNICVLFDYHDYSIYYDNTSDSDTFLSAKPV